MSLRELNEKARRSACRFGNLSSDTSLYTYHAIHNKNIWVKKKRLARDMNRGLWPLNDPSLIKQRTHESYCPRRQARP